MQRRHARTEAGSTPATHRKPPADTFDPHFPRRDGINDRVVRRVPDTPDGRLVAYDPHFRPREGR
ncbi:hypothetical protein [Methylobacterium platani]|uniref:Uncharacterized protein n=2 Tax=Methylobacterium platani TaxID=427683 RepID=A0A179S1S6_9HYPH|nr:hypothetical protein [Methylobacterium platani]OAS18943.1 hypothetical protein A5481_25395 [Methylobacterium platani]